MDPDPDPLVRGTDPGIWIRIRTKMSRIRNIGTINTYDFILGSMMAPDPDKASVLVKEKRSKKVSKHDWAGADKYKEYEKKRRDNFTLKMNTLCRLLPNFDRTEQVPVQ